MSQASAARAACLPDISDVDSFTYNPSSPEATTKFIVSGWGTLSSGGSKPKELHHVTVPFVSQEVCSQSYDNVTDITSNMICAGNIKNGGVDSCQDDSGGKKLTLIISFTLQLFTSNKNLFFINCNGMLQIF